MAALIPAGSWCRHCDHYFLDHYPIPEDAGAAPCQRFGCDCSGYERYPHQQPTEPSKP